MNRTPHEETERLLAAGLNARADRMGGSRIDVDEVRTRAVRITRNRRLGTTVGIAAAVAVITPFAYMVAPGSGDASIDPVEQRTERPTRTVTTELDPRELTAGDLPAVAWYAEGRLHRDGGEVLPLRPDGELWQFAVLRPTGTLVLRLYSEASGESIRTLVPTDGMETGRPSTGPLRVNASGTTAAWLAVDGTPLLLHADESEPLALDAVAGEAYSMAAIAGDQCRTEPVGHDCVGYVNVSFGGEPQVWVATLAGGPQEPLTALAELIAQHSGPVGGLDSPQVGITRMLEDTTVCSALIGSRADGNPETLWETCERGFGAFSPDGRHLIGRPSIGSGRGDTEIAFVDAATAEDRAVFTVARPNTDFVHSVTWEDDEHLLAVTHHDGAWSVVRLGLDGSTETALPPIPGDDVTPAYVLETRH